METRHGSLSLSFSLSLSKILTLNCSVPVDIDVWIVSVTTTTNWWRMRIIATTVTQFKYSQILTMDDRRRFALGQLVLLLVAQSCHYALLASGQQGELL